MMHTRYALVLLAALALPFVGGCGTYFKEKAGVLSGEPDGRVVTATEGVEAETDKAIGLETDVEVLAEEEKSLDSDLAELARRVEDQQAKISDAEKKNKIDRARELEMRDKIRSLDDAISTAQNGLLEARASNNAKQEKALEEQLDKLKSKADELDEEIEVLSE